MQRTLLESENLFLNKNGAERVKNRSLYVKESKEEDLRRTLRQKKTVF